MISLHKQSKSRLIYCTSSEIKTFVVHTDWEKIFSDHIYDKWFVSRIYKELLKLNNKRINNPIKKWPKDLNGHVLKEDIWMSNKQIKRCSTLLVTRECDWSPQCDTTSYLQECL